MVYYFAIVLSDLFDENGCFHEFFLQKYLFHKIFVNIKKFNKIQKKYSAED